jgi:2-isopropylmalate synthase
LPDTENPGQRIVEATLIDNGREISIEGRGTGPVDGFVDALCQYLEIDFSVADYSEHSMKQGSDATAICYMEVEHDGGRLFGAGINANIVAASLEAVVSAANRIVAKD